jgi:endo-1,4-beta-D-glucanase Y
MPRSTRLLALPLVACLALLALVPLTCATPQPASSTGGSGGTTGNGCPSGSEKCGGVCVDTSKDSANCGACGTACQTGQQCTAGNCACLSGLTACGSSCVQTSSDPAHCGGCSTACSSTQVCNMGTCGTTCSGGLMNCSGACVNLTGNDANNCGACGTKCPGGQACNAGHCGCSTAGETLCGSTCVNTSTSGTNCGTCGKSCGAGQVCNGGTCGCASGQVMCSNGSCAASQAACGGGTGGATGTGGAGTGGSGTGGAGGGTRTCAAMPNVISDFEEGAGVTTAQGGRTGWWYVFADALGGSATPASSSTGPVAAAAVPTTDPNYGTCNHFAMHATATGRTGTSTSAYVGFGTSLAQIMPAPAAGAKSKNAYDLSTYTGISFKIKSGSGTAPPIWFEVLNTESQPFPDGTASSPLAAAPTGKTTVQAYDTRGVLLSNVSTTWQTVVVPFGLMAPRSLPSGTTCTGSPGTCEAPPWNPKSALGLQFSMYPQFTNATSYDLWVDDVTLVTDNSGLTTFPASTPMASKPFPRDATYVGCTKPNVPAASGRFLVNAYNNWKARFVTGTGANTKVQRPENGNDTVSEGIAYGMLLAAYMGDKTLFDGLYGYWQGHASGGLMTWCIPSGGGSCSASGGSATDADEDAAFALIIAGKQWGGTYASQASTLIGQIWTGGDIDPTSLLPTGGSNYKDTSGHVTNPSYFAPAYYRVFAGIDTAHNWNGVVTAVYKALNNSAIKGMGLVPAWCQNNCTAVGSNGGPDDMVYQYDSHRVPWRVGVDACWTGSADAKSWLGGGNTAFFAGKAAAGLGSVVDIYTLGGAANGDAKPNSMSAVGTAAVGAMANAGANMDFLNRGYQFILDASYTADPPSKMSAYTYFNASVGLMSAMTMSGNFNPPSFWP